MIDDVPSLHRADALPLRSHRLLIGGAWVESASGKRFAVTNPASGEVIASVAEGERQDVDDAVVAARRSFLSGAWSRLAPAERARTLWRIAEAIETHREELAELETRDNGMALGVSRMLVGAAAEAFRYYAGWCTKIEGIATDLSRGPVEMLGYTLREPVGVAGLIVPWNVPLVMAATKLAPALAAGCSCVLKPAEETPLTALRLGELVLEAGVPDGVVNIVTGYGETAGAALAAHPDVDKIAFTGSTEVGRLIVAAAAGNLKKVTLELGGKSPVFVFEDADLETTIPMVAMAIFRNSGQVCAAGSRLYVAASIYDRVVEGVAAVAKRLKLGDGMSPESELGPLISQKQSDRVLAYVESGTSDGAEVVTGGARLERPGYFVEPTVVANTAPWMRMVREEIFGPVLAVARFDDSDDVAALANDTPFGLAASIWTRDGARAHKLAKRLRAGTVGINTHPGLHLQMPFGGYKQSGWGRENGFDALANYLETKSVFTLL